MSNDALSLILRNDTVYVLQVKSIHFRRPLSIDVSRMKTVRGY